jgi:hypothetical protein
LQQYHPWSPFPLTEEVFLSLLADNLLASAFLPKGIFVNQQSSKDSLMAIYLGYYYNLTWISSLYRLERMPGAEDSWREHHQVQLSHTLDRAWIRGPPHIQQQSKLHWQRFIPHGHKLSDQSYYINFDKN